MPYAVGGLDMAIKADARATLTTLFDQRLRANADQIRHSLHQIAIGNPLGAETEPSRVIGRLTAKLGGSREEAERAAAQIEKAAAADQKSEMMGVQPSDGREAIWGATLDFLDVSFLDRGVVAADAVGRVAYRDDRAQGSGFVVAPGLFLTNHHVISSPSAAAQFCVQFRYERQSTVRGDTGTFAFDPDKCFVTDDVNGLDFTLIAIGPQIGGKAKLGSIPWLPMSDAPNKHMLGEVANIIQHPKGRYKELVLRENQLVARDEMARVLHYIADTEPGSSGSPVFNNDWQVIALHHWGGPWLEGGGLTGQRREINEGVRASEIVKYLRAKRSALDPSNAEMVARALQLWDGQSAPYDPSGGRPNPSIKTISESNVTSEATRRQKEDFSDRGGYEPGFLRGVLLPLPDLPREHTAARNLEARIGDDPYELRYHHFSIVMNGARRLAYFTACNIDGSRMFAINRQTGAVTEDPSLGIMDLESAEASGDFRPDHRVGIDEQMTKPFYEAQIVAGYPVATSGGRKARMFQKGHIVLRSDPSWGTEAQAVAAEQDTFFYTNAAPQVGFFNQGSEPNRPGQKGKLRWRAVETFVLRNAITERQRVTVFAGPIFRDDDPEYRFGSQVPLRFWKIACWVADGKLHAIALIANQAPVLTVMPESLGAEQFDDDDELARVGEFLTTVAFVEKETGLDFGALLRGADVRRGMGSAEGVSAATPALLKRTAGANRAPAKKAAKKKTAKKKATVKKGR